MISDKMQEALNQSLNLELFSAYSYAAMAAYFDTLNLDGFIHWMQLQMREELDHAGKFYKYINDIGGRVVLTAIEKPQTDFDSPLHAFEAAYKNECTVTKGIHQLMDLAQKENDHSTQTFLQWFVAEQVEEEKLADDVVKKLRLVGSDPNGLFLLDRELAKRTAGTAESA